MPQPRPVESGRRGRRRAFSADAIADTALRVLDERGADGLTIRALAAELGVHPNAVYTYVADRADLQRLVVEKVLRDIVAPASGGTRERILALVEAMYDAVESHPGIAPILGTAPMDGPAARRVGEELLGAFAAAGLAPAAASRATYALLVQVIGFAALAVAETDGRAPLSPELDRVAGRRGAIAAADLGDWPLTTATRDVMADWVSRDQLRWSVQRLLDGILETTRS